MPAVRVRRFVVAGLVGLFVAAYVTTVVLYARTGCGCPRQLTAGHPAADGTTVTINIEELQSAKGALTGNVTVVPGEGSVDPVTHGLKEELTVAIHSVAVPTKRTWTKGTVPGVFPVPLTMSGEASDWPFDHYRTGPITVDLFRGAATLPEHASVIFIDRVPGWKLDVVAGDSGVAGAPSQIQLRRSPSTAAFGAVVLAVMIALAGVAAFVAVQTARNRRKFQPPMTTWYAAMLFAVVPLRNALPDAPPIGSWIDVTITLWVIVVLASSMLLYILCWWWHLRPETEKADGRGR